MLTLRRFRDKKVLLPVSGALLVATLLLATAVSGRSGRVDPSAAASASTSSTQAPATITTGPTPSAPTTTEGPGPISRVIQWMNEHGPTGGGASGPDEEAYYLMMQGDCAGALSIAERELISLGRTLYTGVASGCLAAFGHRPELWPRAEAALGTTRGHAARFDCEMRAVYELLRRMVEVHRSEPSARLVKRPVGKRALICPRFTKITPDHGPAEGGYTVELEGENLPRVVGVNFLQDLGSNHHVKAISRDGRHVVITVPRAATTDADTPAVVEPDGARLWSDSAVQFRYDPPATTTRPSTTTSSTTTTTQLTAPTSTTTPPPSSS